MYECIIWVFCESIFVLLYQLIFTKTYDDGWLNGARAQHMLFFIGFILILFFLLASRTIRSRLPMLLFFSIFGSLCSKTMLSLKKKRFLTWIWLSNAFRFCCWMLAAVLLLYLFFKQSFYTWRNFRWTFDVFSFSLHISAYFSFGFWCLQFGTCCYCC